MKHAGDAALQSIQSLLELLRARSALRERSPGVFYFKSKAFLHFHEDPAGLFADLREGLEFVRLPVDGSDDAKRLIARVDALLRDGERAAVPRRRS